MHYVTIENAANDNLKNSLYILLHTSNMDRLLVIIKLQTHHIPREVARVDQREAILLRE